MDLGIEGRVAVITGGARGIGFAEAEALGAEGAVIAINDIDSVAAMDAAAILRARGIQASAFPADAADEAEVAEAMRKIAAKFGKIAILVNNAGIGGKPDYSAHEMPVEVWDSMQRVHVRSTFLWSRAAIPLMRLGGYGRIVNTSSMNYTGGGRPGASHYVAAKASIAGFTRVLAKEVGPDGITVNAIAPGYVATELIGGFSSPMLAVIREQNPTRRLCEPNEIGALVAYLASRQAGFINGEIVCIDGGRREFYWGNTA